VRRVTVARRLAVGLMIGLAAVPLLIGLGASTTDPVELESLRQANENLRVENDSYRAATGELADQISSLQSALTQLGDQSQLDPQTRQALEKLPAYIRSKAAGGGTKLTSAPPPAPAAASSTPESTFGVLKSLLGALENRLASVKTKVENEQALARATPSIWPIAGWLSSAYGKRTDPFKSEDADFHPGLDIAADRGTPIHATADGAVETAGYNGNYGLSVLIEHGYGIGTRFGHMSSLAVKPGQKVRRGDVIGYVGSTGHATGPHLHYEILFNGRPINPLGLLARQ
jgi:murein DD-endopeptidase MepM/ murein hydrolase activator NlpD